MSCPVSLTLTHNLYLDVVSGLSTKLILLWMVLVIMFLKQVYALQYISTGLLNGTHQDSMNLDWPQHTRHCTWRQAPISLQSPDTECLASNKKIKTYTVIVFSMFAIELYLNSFRCCLSCVHIHLHPSVITALGLENVFIASSTDGCNV